MLPNCPKCNCEYTYEMSPQIICPECGYEWIAAEEKKFKDANGNVLENGDTVVTVKDLKVKGSSTPLKQGTKVKNIRLVDGDHDIECRIEGFGAMQLKTSVVKKAK